jgi:hypothetical protein
VNLLKKLFGRREHPELVAALAHIRLLQDDERTQNSMLNEYLKAKIQANHECDEVPWAEGEFGFDPSNPIPVNGPIGEIAYLSKLRTIAGERLFFHRVGSVANSSDKFEAVTFSGSQWFSLYLNMYFPRRSRHAPAGFVLIDEPCSFSGFTQTCANFPFDFVEKKEAMASSGLSAAYMSTRLARTTLSNFNSDQQ